MESPYNSYAAYLRRRYGKRVQRLSVDAGFSCPHRGADRSAPGCSFCDSGGSRAPYLQGVESVDDQIDRGLEFAARRYGAVGYSLYFQAFTGTFAPRDKLREIYDGALKRAPFVELIVATRPDCIDETVADLLAEYRSPERDVWVELGLQSAWDDTLRRINRGHTVARFREAYHVLRARGLKVTVHLIFGLPGEERPHLAATVAAVAALLPDGLKIHNLHIPSGTDLGREYLAGEVVVPGAERHLSDTIFALERMPAQTVIMRLVCDSPAAKRLAPRTFWDKEAFHRRLRAEMAKLGTWQGRLFAGARAERP